MKLDKTTITGADVTGRERVAEAWEWLNAHGPLHQGYGVDATIAEALRLLERVNREFCIPEGATITQITLGMDKVAMPEPSEEGRQTPDSDARFAEEWPNVDKCLKAEGEQRAGCAELCRLARELWGDLRKLHGIQGDILNWYEKLEEREQQLWERVEGLCTWMDAHSERLSKPEVRRYPFCGSAVAPDGDFWCPNCQTRLLKLAEAVQKPHNAPGGG